MIIKTKFKDTVAGKENEFLDIDGAKLKTAITTELDDWTVSDPNWETQAEAVFTSNKNKAEFSQIDINNRLILELLITKTPLAPKSTGSSVAVHVEDLKTGKLSDPANIQKIKDAIADTHSMANFKWFHNSTGQVGGGYSGVATASPVQTLTGVDLTKVKVIKYLSNSIFSFESIGKETQPALAKFKPDGTVDGIQKANKDVSYTKIWDDKVIEADRTSASGKLTIKTISPTHPFIPSTGIDVPIDGLPIGGVGYDETNEIVVVISSRNVTALKRNGNTLTKLSSTSVSGLTGYCEVWSLGDGIFVVPVGDFWVIKVNNTGYEKHLMLRTSAKYPAGFGEKGMCQIKGNPRQILLTNHGNGQVVAGTIDATTLDLTFGTPVATGMSQSYGATAISRGMFAVTSDSEKKVTIGTVAPDNSITVNSPIGTGLPNYSEHAGFGDGQLVVDNYDASKVVVLTLAPAPAPAPDPLADTHVSTNLEFDFDTGKIFTTELGVATEIQDTALDDTTHLTIKSIK